MYGIESYIAVPFRRRDGRLFGVLCALDSRLSEHTDEILALFTTLADLIAFELEADEQQRALTAAAEQAQAVAATREQFLGSVAHDLKNPLTVILGHAGWMKRLALRSDSVPHSRLLRSAEAIEQVVARMTTSIDDVMDLTRLQLTRSLDLHREPTDLGALVREVAAEQRQTATRHVIVVEGVESLVGKWDRARLIRVIQNLLGNAVRYSPSGGHITISVDSIVETGNHRALLRVADQGIGIPAAELPSIFEQFRRGSNVIGVVDGTGVGLFSVRQIVELHGGHITVESREGHGSTFSVELPLGEIQIGDHRCL
jgi:signal transduction histidine kinase